MYKQLIILAIFIISVECKAQQDPILTQYMYHLQTINPGYVGSSECLSLNLTDRMQWVGMKNGPNTMVFSAGVNLPNPHIGIGLSASRDALGPSVETGMMGSFAYRILFEKSKLSFGVQFGFDYLYVDWAALIPDNPDDPLITNQVKNRAVPDAGVGIYYYSDKYYFGISSTHLLEEQFMIATDNQTSSTSFSKLLRHFYGMAGYVIPVSDEITLKPSVLLRYVANSPLQADINFNMLIHSIIWIGVGYRTESSITLMTEVNIAKGLRVGYSYDMWFNPLQSNSKGSHEIRLGYDLDLFNTGRMSSPRYF
jgi:type IX secretion system PorP/SprF family membrane protein